jgi:tRNA G18 (ribose-2'-O)-methylase SpoU
MMRTLALGLLVAVTASLPGHAAEPDGLPGLINEKEARIVRWMFCEFAKGRIAVRQIARTLEDLKAQNIWTVGLDERGAKSYESLDYNMDCAIVLGAEGKGLHDLVARKCDFLVSIPMLGKVPSLNVSVAAGVVLYEVVRQRRKL